jgi:hypothetical protein
MVKHSANERYPYTYGGGHGDAGRVLLAERDDGRQIVVACAATDKRGIDAL